ncbi:MAG: CHASE2 domain-containing protein, partial [Nitrospinota bacterium]
MAVPAWFSELFRLDRLVIGVGLTALVLVAYFFDRPQRLELMALDARFKIRGPKEPGPEVVVAVIDEKSLDQLGRWPWPRKIQAQLVDRLVSYGARVVGYDVTFPEPDTSGGILTLKEMRRRLASAGADGNSSLAKMLDEAIREADYDGIFARALERSQRVILGYFFHRSRAGVEHLPERELRRSLQNIRSSKYRLIQKDPGVSLKSVPLRRAYGVESSIEPLSRAARGGGFFSMEFDSDGAVRWYPLIVKYRDMVEIPGEQDYLFAPLAIRVLERYLGANALFQIGEEGVKKVALLGRGKFEVPTNERGEMLINFLGPRRTFPHYSIADIVLGRQDAAPPSAFREKIVLVGPTAPAIKDLSVTPFDKSLPGVEIHATVIDNILRRDFLVRPWWAPLFDAGLIVLLGVILMVVLPPLGALWGGVIPVVLLAAHLGLNYYLFAGPRWWLNATYPTL